MQPWTRAYMNACARARTHTHTQSKLCRFIYIMLVDLKLQQIMYSENYELHGATEL